MTGVQTCALPIYAGIDRLEAFSFDQDSVNASVQAQTYGIETSADGVYVPELPEDSEAGPISRPASAFMAPRKTDYDVFGAAILLIALVLVTTLLLAWVGPYQPLSYVKQAFAMMAGAPRTPSSQPTAKESHAKPPRHESPLPTTDQGPRASSPENPPADVAPVIPSDAVVAPSQPNPLVTPTALSNNNDTNAMAGAVPALPVDPNQAVPALPVVPDSAFDARLVAESTLDASIFRPTGTGHADLVRIVGKRGESQASPPSWTFYFYDVKAPSHVRIISVRDHKVVKNGVDYLHHFDPYTERDILPEDKLLTDSTQALQIAQQQIPTVVPSSSEVELVQKNSVPSWKVTLWARNAEGEEISLGNVMVLAEKGYVSSNTLKPDRLIRH